MHVLRRAGSVRRCAGCTATFSPFFAAEDKAQLLRALGTDRVINCKAESVKEVLKKEYPKGVDLIYESGWCWRGACAAGAAGGLLFPAPDERPPAAAAHLQWAARCLRRVWTRWRCEVA